MKRKRKAEGNISRRDFMKKGIRLASAGAVLGGIGAVQGVCPPKAEAEAGCCFIRFMEIAQWDKPLTDEVIELVNPANKTQSTCDDLKKLVHDAIQKADGTDCWLSDEECDRILKIAGCFSSENYQSMLKVYTNSSPTCPPGAKGY